MPQIEVSYGELIDKLSILEIKISKIVDTEKKIAACKEFDLLLPLATKLDIGPGSIPYEKLISINTRLWNVEDELRIEINKNPNSRFVELAKLVPFLNAERFKVKTEINKLTNSEIVEVKQYATE